MSVLEGGYGVENRRVLDRSNFAQCVLSHVTALVDVNKAGMDEDVEDDGSPSSRRSKEAPDSDDEELAAAAKIPPPSYSA